jgi:uncharacterized protein YqeY
METLKERISREYVDAFKARNTIKKNLLGVIKAEITTQEKNSNVVDLSDENVFKIIKKVSKNISETLSQADNAESREELAIVEEFLPKQMSETEVEAEVVKVISELGASSPADMGKVMGGFNSKFAGKADNKTVSIIVKKLLQK